MINEDAAKLNLAMGSTSRRKLDYYSTPPETTHAVMQFLNLSPCIVWEPACGDGKMSEVIKTYGHKVINTDLQTNYGERNVNFLTEKRECDAIITNPPFGLSEHFITHALEQAPVVAMLVKSQYWHAAKRIALFEEHPPAYILALTWRPDFVGNGGAPIMECQWVVWQQGLTDTRYRLLKRISKGGLL